MAVITISRQYGSGGNQVAALLCQRLGYRYFDKQLMAKLGAPTDVKAELEAAERTHAAEANENPIFRLFRSLWSVGVESTYGARADAEGDLSAEAEAELIRVAYKEDNLVVVGRGGQVILRDKPDVLHVRVVAPEAVREDTIQQFEGVTADVAHDHCQRHDRAAIAYVKQHYGVDPQDPALYDVLLNMEKLTPAVAAEMVMAAVKCLPPR